MLQLTSASDLIRVVTSAAADIEAHVSYVNHDAGAITPALTPEDADVVAALTTLGYSLKEATQAVAGLPNAEELDLEEKVRLALRQLATR